jgi:hypothetical protein
MKTMKSHKSAKVIRFSDELLFIEIVRRTTKFPNLLRRKMFWAWQNKWDGHMRKKHGENY